MCGFTKYPHSLHGRSLEIPRRRGVLKDKHLEDSMKLNWNFLGGEGVQNKTPSMGGVWIFSRTTQCKNTFISLLFQLHFELGSYQ